MFKRYLILLILLFSFPLLATAQGNAISIGETVSGDITDEKPVDTWLLEGTAGTALAIHMDVVTQGLDPYLHVIGPDGTEYFNDDSNNTLNSTLALVLPLDGTYTIEATRCCGERQASGSTGAYQLWIETISVTPIAPGDTLTLEISSEQPVVYLAYDADGATLTRLVANRSVGDGVFSIEVHDPRGLILSSASLLQDGSAYLDPLFAQSPGRYLLVISRQPDYPNMPPSSDSLTLEIQFEHIETQPVAVGDTLTGTLDAQNPVDYYRFTGTPGSLLRLSGSRPEGSSEIEVALFTSTGIGFNGSSTAYGSNPGSFEIDPLQLIESGEYLIVVSRTFMGEDMLLAAGEYTINLGESLSPELVAGTPVESGFDGIVYENVYRYTGRAGEMIRITISSLDDLYAPAFSVQGPELPGIETPDQYPLTFYLNISGNTVATATYEVVLPADGTYLFRVGNGIYNPDNTPDGTYRLLVEVLP